MSGDYASNLDSANSAAPSCAVHAALDCMPTVYEATIVHRLQQLLRHVTGKHDLVSAGGIFAADSHRVSSDTFHRMLGLLFLRQGVPLAGTFVVLLVGCLMDPELPYLLAAVVTFLLYSFYCVLQYELLLARASELRNRTEQTLRRVTTRWAARLPPGAAVISSQMPPTTGVLSAVRSGSFSSDPLGMAVPLSFVVGTEGSLAAPSPPPSCLCTTTTAAARLAPHFIDSAVLCARSVRLVAARFRGSLCVLPKCLLLRGASRLDEFKLRWESYRESVDICKLVDAMKIILDRDAVKLRALRHLSRPPRLPNLRLAALLEEDVETTDESDGEHEGRSVVGGRSTTSVPQQMEHFVMRLFMLAWTVFFPLLMIVGLLRWLLAGRNRNLGAEMLLLPCLALLGLLPLNAFLINRLLYLLNSVVIHCHADWMFQLHRSGGGGGEWGAAADVGGAASSFPRVPLKRALAIVFESLRRPGMDPTRPVYLARSTVETLGTVTVIAELDSTGILTDLRNVPQCVLVIKENLGEDSSTSSDDDDERLFLTQQALEATKQKKREMRNQVRRKRFQENRFTEIRLSVVNGSTCANNNSCASPPALQSEWSGGCGGGASGDLPLKLEFSEEKDKHDNAASIHPVCLCILVHAFCALRRRPASQPVGGGGGVDSDHENRDVMDFSDRTRSWAVSLLAVARAAGFADDTVAAHFDVVARVFAVRTSKRADSEDNRYPEQLCSLFCRDGGGQTHVFTMGTPRMVCDAASSYWTGKDTEEFDDYEKAEVVFVAEKQWGAAQGITPVALAHRVLPDRYQRFVATLDGERQRLGTAYTEHYYVNGTELSRSSPSVTPSAPMENSIIGGSDAAAGSFRLTKQSSAERLADYEFRTSLAASALTSAVSGGAGGGSGGGVMSCASGVGSGILTMSTAATVAGKLRRVLSHGDMPQYHGGPIEADATLSNDTFVLLGITTNQTLLGLAALRDAVRPHLHTAIQALDDAGIRFMHFASQSEQRCKAFGDQLGLETDWNCCISLKEDRVALDPHSIRAQLPFGVPSIRKHIVFVDPIPLQVNLFSHARSVSTRSMISVLQDNHEVVLAIGSLYNHATTRSFVQADYSIGVIPSTSAHPDSLFCGEACLSPGSPSLTSPPSPQGGAHGRREHHHHQGGAVPRGGGPDSSSPGAAARAPRTPMDDVVDDVAELLSSACSMHAGKCTNILPIVVHLIRQSRQLLRAMGNCVEFILCANVFVVLSLMLQFLLGLPLFLTPGSIVFLGNVVIPILGIACHYSQRDIDIMKVKPCKQNFDSRLKIFGHGAHVFLWRYAPSLALSVAAPLVLVRLWCDQTNPWRLAVSALSVSDESCLADVRSLMFLATVQWLTVHSLTQLSRHQPLFALPAWLKRMLPAHWTKPLAANNVYVSLKPMSLTKSTHWLRFAGSALVVATLVHFLVEHTPRSYLKPRHPTVIFVILWMYVVYPVIVLVLDVPIKAWRAKRYSDNQKFRTLSYGTRLGMHSPRGDYEPNPDEVDNSSNAVATSTTTATETAAAATTPNSQVLANNSTSSANGFTPPVVNIATTVDSSAVPNEDQHNTNNNTSNSNAVRKTTWKHMAREFLFRWCSVAHGALELNCVCCDHDGGHPAQYC